MAGTNINDIIIDKLTPTYGPANISTLLRKWMVAVSIKPYSPTAIRDYIVAAVPSLAGKPLNDQIRLYFKDTYVAP